MPSETLQKRAQLLLIAVAQAMDPAPDAVFGVLPEEFKQPGSIIVIGRPVAVAREHFGNDRVLVTLNVRCSFLHPFKPHVEGEQEGLENVDALRDRFIVAVESQPGNALLTIGAFSWQHQWELSDEYPVVGNNLVGNEAMLTVTLVRPRDHAIFVG